MFLDGIIQIDSELGARMVMIDATLWNHVGSWKKDKKEAHLKSEGEGRKIRR